MRDRCKFKLFFSPFYRFGFVKNWISNELLSQLIRRLFQKVVHLAKNLMDFQLLSGERRFAGF